MAVITVNNLTKIFRLENRRETSLKQEILSCITRRRQAGPPLFTALDNISFSVEKGDILGLIGKNGAGKTTLLKLLSGILTPNCGTIQVTGNVSPILALGSGFNGELTGMENIYLNASLFGYTNAETARRIPDIVSFSELDKWIHEPVKNYSSGMVMRLAFSISIHLDHEILLLDEIFSVGDTSFQAKCERRMNELAAQGITVVMSSHDTRHIAEFCGQALYLHKGSCRRLGPALDVLDDFLADIDKETQKV